ncbi:hypothetical protein CDD81_7887 [Ophiocordyceps australis]|uniref:Aminoacyl-transfer RNA synthetases class-II family profile domain-containing protein n=1 Tax=Ophiocordyceps australis TaxID=1399860 RepID=A0A2C5YH25_9HYPO|nr:hypothetical protein CDD81_7887 [Ophiocordyceps australis]
MAWTTRRFHTCKASKTPEPVTEEQTTHNGERQVEADEEKAREVWNKYPTTSLKSKTQPNNTLFGFIGKCRKVGKMLSFAHLTMLSGEQVQICSKAEMDPAAHHKFNHLPAWSPVRLEVYPQDAVQNSSHGNSSRVDTLHIKDCQILNAFPHNIIVTPVTQFPRSQRHLQIRFHPELQARLRFRSWLKAQFTQSLLEKDFIDIETPTLFKPTCEGAREFLVPSRRIGFAYALSQSPQQYKQVLMASGFSRYMQWARCFRDEDLRADRQPEFSQLDLEWAFANADDVRKDISELVLKALSALCPSESYQDVRGYNIPIVAKIPSAPSPDAPPAHKFTAMTYAKSMALYGTDKPDLRIPNRIHTLKKGDVGEILPLLTSLTDPVIDVLHFSLEESRAAEAQEFVTETLNDKMLNLCGLNLQDRPVVIVHGFTSAVRNTPLQDLDYQQLVKLASGGEPLRKGQDCASPLEMGQLRPLLWKALVEKGFMKTPRLGEANSLQFVWVTEFPMFQRLEEREEDLELLFTDPLQAKSAAYDLVLNGVEVGGGSDERIADFQHLFKALSAGCPPHAGFALGFDRLVAIMTDTATDQLRPYGLQCLTNNTT